MPENVYLDAAASTPLAPEAMEAMMEAFGRAGNPGAAHAAGYAAARMVDRARRQVAELMRVGPASVVFTASATEANNLALRGFQASPVRRGIVTTAAEHASVLDTANELRASGRSVTVVPVVGSGEVYARALSDVVSGRTALVSIHAANNETGVIQPLEEVVAIAHDRGALVHVDASQLMAWGPAQLLDECDLVTVSSHKMHGPQGAAALIVRRAARDFLHAQITGGGQENGLRSGTLNVAAIAGFGAAAQLATESGSDAASATASLRARLRARLVSDIQDVVEHGTLAARRLPGILNVAIGASSPESVESEALLARTPNLAASTGSACHAGAPGPSPVLLAMGVSEWQAARSIRLSLSRYSTAADVDRAATALIESYREIACLLGGTPHEERYVR